MEKVAKELACFPWLMTSCDRFVDLTESLRIQLLSFDQSNADVNILIIFGLGNISLTVVLNCIIVCLESRPIPTTQLHCRQFRCILFKL